MFIIDIAYMGVSIMKSRALKLLVLNLVIVLLNVILFSKGIVGLSFSGGALSAAFAATDIVMSIIAFFYGNYVLLFHEPSEPEPAVQFLKGNELSKPQEYIDALEEKRKDNPSFDEEITTAEEQISRMQEKDRALESILGQFFVPQEITFTRFRSAVNSVQAIFYNNVKKMINRMVIFDNRDYSKLSEKLSRQNEGGVSIPRSADAQMKIYSEHIEYVRELVNMNEDILVKLDGLLLEISKLDDLDEKGLENIAAIQEINDLIDQTKYYK